MFYILENTRSSKIIRVLLKCGFDLTKREPMTGNTALHCLFNASKSQRYYDNNKQFNTKQQLLIGNKKQILNEYPKPANLSRILFLMLKMGGLKTHVNTLNNEKKLCTQVLFEWDELLLAAFFTPYAQQTNSVPGARAFRAEWKREFKQCLRLLLKSGADLLLNLNNTCSVSEVSEHHNCVDVLFTNLLKHSLDDVAPPPPPQSQSSSSAPSSLAADVATVGSTVIRGRSPSLPQPAVNVSSVVNSSPVVVTPVKKYRSGSQPPSKTLDVEYLYTILNDVIDLNSVSVNLTRNNVYYHHHPVQVNLFTEKKILI